MSDSILVKVENAVPDKHTWDKGTIDFQFLEIDGIKAGLFEALWKNYEPVTDDTDKVRERWENILTAIATIEKEDDALRKSTTYYWADFGDTLFDLWSIANTACDHLHQKKVSNARHYWIGALWPYCEAKDTTRFWEWLAQWIRHVECHEAETAPAKGITTRKPRNRFVGGGKVKGGRSLQKWASSVRRKAVTVRGLYPIRSLSRQAISSQLRLLSETKRSDLFAITIGIFNTLIWISRGQGGKAGKLAAAKKYLECAHERWPFFKNICPKCTWVLLNTLSKMQGEGL